MKVFSVFLAIILLFAVPASAQWTQYTYPDDILSIATLDNILWCGTIGGVVRYNPVDGSRTVYTTLDGLPLMSISQIIVRDGTVWACNRSAVSRLENGRFVTLYPDNSNPRLIRQLAAGADGSIYAYDLNDHVWEFEDSVWEEIPSPFDDENIKLESIAVGNDNTIFAGTSTGVFSYNGNDWMKHGPSNGLFGENVVTISSGADGTIWAVGQRWLARYDGSSWTEFRDETFDPEYLSVDDTGTVWAGGNAALWRFIDGSFEMFDLNGLFNSGGSFRGLAAGSDGTAWVFPYYFFDSGVAGFDGTSVKRVSFRESILNNSIRAVAVAEDNSVWAGSFSDIVLCQCPDRGGLSRYDGTAWDHFTTAEGLPDVRITDLAFDGNGDLWVATYQNGLSHFDGDNWTVHLDDVDNDTMTVTYISSIAVAPDNSLWAGTIRNGLFHGVGFEWEQFTEENSTLKNEIFSIAADLDNVLWASSLAGLSSFDGETWGLLTVEDGVPDPYVGDIAVDSKNNKWFGLYPRRNSDYDPERGGFAKFDGVSWTHYTEDDGLVHNRVTKVAVDHNDVIWLGTFEGLSRFDGVTFKNWTVENGLTDNYIHDIAFGRDGRVWIGTEYGLCCYDPQMDVFVAHEDVMPSGVSVSAILPNPFNMSTTISVRLDKDADTEINIYNVTGQKVKVLVSEHMQSGVSSFLWNGLDDNGAALSAGLYFVRVASGGAWDTRKMMLVK